MSTPTDWTEYGIFRAAYLSLFDSEDREALRRVGRVLAAQAISGDTADEPIVVAHFQAAIEDARMLADFLWEISEKPEGSEIPTKAGRRLAKDAAHWHRVAADLVSGMERSWMSAPRVDPEEEL